MTQNVYKRAGNPAIDTQKTTKMGRKVLVLKYIENNHDRKRTFNVRLRTLERKIQELEIMTGCHINMDVVKTATNVSSKNTHKKNKKNTPPPYEGNYEKHTAFPQHNNSAFFGEESTSAHKKILPNDQFDHGDLNFDELNI